MRKNVSKRIIKEPKPNYEKSNNLNDLPEVIYLSNNLPEEIILLPQSKKTINNDPFKIPEDFSVDNNHEFVNPIIPELKSISVEVSNLCERSRKKTDVTSLKISNSKKLNSHLITDDTTKDINSFPKFGVILNKKFQPKSESNYIKTRIKDLNNDKSSKIIVSSLSTFESEPSEVELKSTFLNNKCRIMKIKDSAKDNIIHFVNNKSNLYNKDALSFVENNKIESKQSLNIAVKGAFHSKT